MLRIGIVGTGYGAAVHLPAFDGLPGVRVTALADGGSGRARRAAAALDPPPTPLADGLALARSDAVDAVSIAVPPEAQARLALAALAAGKPVLCEKPLGRTLDEAARIAEAASGLAGAVGFAFRYDPGLHALLGAARRGRVGRVRRISVAWLTAGGADPGRPWTWRHDCERGGGILNEFASHVVDYARLVVGAPIVRVWCRTEVLIAARRDAGGALRPVTAPDACDMICDFADGAVGQFAVSNACRSALGHRVEVFGEAGRLTFHHAPPFRPGGAVLRLEPVGGPPADLPAALGATAGDGDSRIGAFRALAGDFVASIRGEPAPWLPTFADGLAVRRVLAAAEAADRTGAAVAVDAA